MKVFITGGSGFVGGHAIERLAREHEVFALARSSSSEAKVRGYGATPVRGDLDTVSADLLRGMAAVVHAAAFVEEWGTRADFWSANVDGTQRMLDAARAAGVSRFIHIGTEAAVFDGRDLVHIDETYPYPAEQKYLYSETKAEAERRVLAANTPTLATLSLRPRLVWGPRDTSVLPAILQKARDGSFAWIDGGRHDTSTVYVGNLAEAIACALTRGRGGEAYFIADDGVRTYREFFTAATRAHGVTLTDKEIPRAVARTAARAVEAIWRTFNVKKTPPITRFAADMMSATVTVNTRKARDELGYRPVFTVDEGLAKMRESSQS